MYQINLLKSGFGFRSTVPDQHSGSEAAVCTDGGAGGEVRLLLSDLFLCFSSGVRRPCRSERLRVPGRRLPDELPPDCPPTGSTARFSICSAVFFRGFSLRISAPGFPHAKSKTTPRNRTSVVWKKSSSESNSLVFCSRF